MTTDMLEQYRKHRAYPQSHWQACIAIARRFGFDKDTVDRIVKRAERDNPKGKG